MNLNEKIKAKRIKQDLSLRKLSVLIGVSHTIINRFEKGASIEHESFLKLQEWYFGNSELKDLAASEQEKLKTLSLESYLVAFGKKILNKIYGR